VAHYASETAFRAALGSRLRQRAQQLHWPTQEVARAFVLQQFSSRLFRSDSAEQWVLTGGTALQYRSTEARPTADADLAFALEASEVETALRHALEPEPGEYGTFELALSRTKDGGNYTGRLTYNLAGQRFANASIDVNTTRPVDFAPDVLTPEALVSMPDLAPPPPLRIYPVHRHLADKLAAMYDTYGATGANASTRPHDLADIVILSRSSTVDAPKLLAAVRQQEAERSVTIPTPLHLPTPAWASTYPKRVEETTLPKPLHDVHNALAAANRFVGPVLTGQIVQGQWNPTHQQWVGPGAAAQTPSVGDLLRAAQPERTRPATRQPHQPTDRPPLDTGTGWQREHGIEY
jgi:predicted nucleotidyltransferase component of viral defense system